MKVFILAVIFLSLTSNSSAFFNRIFGKIFPKNQCPIKLYDPKDPSFTGVKLYANVITFHPLLQNLSHIAKRCHVKINVKQAFVQENSVIQKVLPIDRTSSAFQLGEAIEFELLDQDNKLLCNRLCIEKSLSQLKRLPNAKCFLKKLSRNHDLQQDLITPAILRKRRTNESLISLDDKRNDLQKKCKKFHF
jgi:hypothetical protein